MNETTLTQRLLSRIPNYSQPNGRNWKPKEKKETNYFHISNHYFTKVDKDGVERLYRQSLTYTKPQE